MRSITSFELDGRRVEVVAGADSVWLMIRRDRLGGLALRAAYTPGGCRSIRRPRPRKGERLRLRVESQIGIHDVSIATPASSMPVLRVTTRLTAAEPLLVPYFPRDLYPLDENDDPMGCSGKVEAAQRGLNTGLCFLVSEHGGFGSTLYLQNLTALNDYFHQTDTKPDGAVGGLWPELGFLPPTPRQSPTPPKKPIRPGRPVTISDAFLSFHDATDGDEQSLAQCFLNQLAAVLYLLEAPPTEFRDWPRRAEQTLNDLDQSDEATISHYGCRYIHPYTGAEYPDVMVQLSLIAALRDYEAWCGKPVPLRRELQRGLPKFFDKRLGTLRRYLPNVGKDKNADAVDSWYLFHPLLNLGRLALDGDKPAERLFLKSLDYSIRAARHFGYKFPVQFDIRDYSIITKERGDGLGQTDCAGIYAYVMLQAFELTSKTKYLGEARKAIGALKDMRFELNYQANLTAWGAAACMRLWRIDNREEYLRQSYVYLASFFHNSAIWESEIGWARYYSNFLGASALHDAPYMALFECYDSYAAFEEYLRDGGPDLNRAVRTLLSEYCRYALHRTWFYYPDALPRGAISPKQREPNGKVKRSLSFPVEDVYIDGQQAGQVGQEVYGAGAAFVFATRAFHLVTGAPFQIFCDQFLTRSERPTERQINFQVDGAETRTAKLMLLRTGRTKLPRINLTNASGEQIRPASRKADRIEYLVPATEEYALRW
ncbi:MAG: hypothetical protein ACJ8E4_10835 [Sphingomicrobium sp.]